MKCFSIDVRIYSTCASSSPLSLSFNCFVILFYCLLSCFILAFCPVDIHVCIDSTSAYLTVKWFSMLIMYSAASS